MTPARPPLSPARPRVGLPCHPLHLRTDTLPRVSAHSACRPHTHTPTATAEPWLQALPLARVTYILRCLIGSLRRRAIVSTLKASSRGGSIAPRWSWPLRILSSVAASARMYCSRTLILLAKCNYPHNVLPVTHVLTFRSASSVRRAKRPATPSVWPATAPRVATTPTSSTPPQYGRPAARHRPPRPSSTPSPSGPLTKNSSTEPSARTIPSTRCGTRPRTCGAISCGVLNA